MKVYLTFEDMQDDPAAVDFDANDIVLDFDRRGQHRWIGGTWRPDSSFYLDLSPLSKFIWKRRSLAESYWIDWFVAEPVPAPEPSPQEKALDDFIAKRKALRDRDAPPPTIQDAYRLIAQDAKDAETERALDRAMQKLIPAETDFRARLVNVKVGV